MLKIWGNGKIFGNENKHSVMKKKHSLMKRLYIAY